MIKNKEKYIMLNKIKYAWWDFTDWITSAILVILALIIGIPFVLLLVGVMLVVYTVYIVIGGAYNLIAFIINGIFELLKGGK
jgi:hypothetical protein